MPICTTAPTASEAESAAAAVAADEYIILEEGVASLPQLLQQYKTYGGLGLHYRSFSFSGHVLRPPGGVLSSYTACIPGSTGYIKSIVQPRFVKRVETVHNVLYTEGQYAVNTEGTRLDGPILHKGKACLARSGKR